MLDSEIIAFVNGFAHKSPIFDHLVDLTIGRPLLKAGPVTGLLWYLWFRDERLETRQRLVAAVIMSVVALFLARALALSLPFRARPLSDPAINFVMPYGIDGNDDLINWSSFPSDHGALFFALAAGFLVVSRRWGVAALLFSTFMICLPRLYAGYHYPSDLLAGAAIGIACGGATVIAGFTDRLAAPALRLLRARPELYYTSLFFVTFEITNNFNDVRHAAGDAVKLLAMALH
jgi:undecaprenyl-diphosphatase